MSLTKTLLVLLLGILVVHAVVSDVNEALDSDIPSQAQIATENAEGLLNILTKNFVKGISREIYKFEQEVTYESLPQVLQCGDVEPLLDKNTATLQRLKEYGFNDAIFTGTIDDLLPLLLNISKGVGNREKLAADVNELLSFTPIPVKSPFVVFMNEALINIFQMIKQEYFLDGSSQLVSAERISGEANTINKCYLPLLMRMRGSISQLSNMLTKLHLLLKGSMTKLIAKAQSCDISVPEQIKGENYQFQLPKGHSFNFIQMKATMQKHDPDMWDDLFSAENIIQKTEETVANDNNMQSFLKVVPSMKKPSPEPTVAKLSENAVQTNTAEVIPATKNNNAVPSVEVKTSSTSEKKPSVAVPTPEKKEASTPAQPAPAAKSPVEVQKKVAVAAPVETKAAPAAETPVKKISKLPKKPLKLATEVKPDAEPAASPKKAQKKAKAPIAEVVEGPAPMRQARKASPTVIEAKKFDLKVDQEPQVMHVKKHRMPTPEMLPRLAKQAKNDTKPAGGATAATGTSGNGTAKAETKDEKKDAKADDKKDAAKKDDKKKDDKKDGKKDDKDKKDKKDEECQGCGCPNRDIHAAPVVHPDEAAPSNQTEIIGGVSTIARKLKLSPEKTKELNMMPKISEKKDAKLPENEVGTPIIADSGPMVPNVPLNYKAQLKPTDENEVAGVVNHLKRQPMPDLPMNFHAGAGTDDSTPIADPTPLHQLNRLPKLPQTVSYKKLEDDNQVADFSYRPARRQRPMTMDIDMDIQVKAPEILTQSPGSLIGEAKEKQYREVDSSAMQAPRMGKGVPEAGNPLEKSEEAEETQSIDTHLDNNMVNGGGLELGAAIVKGEKERHSHDVDAVVPKARRVVATDVGSPMEKADEEKANDSYDIVADQKKEVVQLEPGQERDKEITNDQIDNVPMIPKAVNSLQIGESFSWEQWKQIKGARRMRRKAHKQWELTMSDDADF